MGFKDSTIRALGVLRVVKTSMIKGSMGSLGFISSNCSFGSNKGSFGSNKGYMGSNGLVRGLYSIFIWKRTF